MAQIGLLVIAVGLLFGGIIPLLGWEKSKEKTPPGVAWTMIVFAVALTVFAVIALPGL